MSPKPRPGFPTLPTFATPERARLADAVRALIDAVMIDRRRRRRRCCSTSPPRSSSSPSGSARGRDERRGLPRRAATATTSRARPIVGEASPLVAAHRLGSLADDALDGKPRRRGARHVRRAVRRPARLRARRDDRAARSTRCSASPTSRPAIPGMTGRLIVHYRKPTPLFHELRFRAVGRPGRGPPDHVAGRALGRRDAHRRGRRRCSCGPAPSARPRSSATKAAEALTDPEPA